MSKKERIILALDVREYDEAIDIVRTFRDRIDVFKVGFELFTAAGPRIIKEIHLMGKKVFLDLKFHDIPNTVAKAALAAAELGVFMFNVHALGGLEMMRQTAQQLGSFVLSRNIARPKLIGITILTSIDQKALRDELGIDMRMATAVRHLAALAHSAGLDGVVSSPEDVEMIRARFGKDFLIVTPGIRPFWASEDDQKRTLTPRQALQRGADFLVIGRAILAQSDPLGALNKIEQEIADV